MVTGRSVSVRDLEHVHHRLLVLGLSQLQSVLLLYGVAFVFNALSVLLVYNDNRRIAWSVMILAVLVGIGFARFLGYLRPSQATATAELRRKNQLLRRAVKSLEHRLLVSQSDGETNDALDEFQAAIRFVQKDLEEAERRIVAAEKRR